MKTHIPSCSPSILHPGLLTCGNQPLQAQGDCLHWTGCAPDVLALLPEATSASLEEAPVTRGQRAVCCSIQLKMCCCFSAAPQQMGLLLVAAFLVCGLNKEGAWTMDGLLSRFSMLPPDKYKLIHSPPNSTLLGTKDFCRIRGESK